MWFPATRLLRRILIFSPRLEPRKVATVTGSLDHVDDALRGPLRLNFVATKGNAKFNTVEIKNAEGASVVSFKASELADAFSASARRVPDIKEPTIWRDPSRSVKDRANDLIRRMSLAEKVDAVEERRAGNSTSRFAGL